MAKICFIRHETDYGPFFSDQRKAAAHLKDVHEHTEAEIAKIVAGSDPYTAIVEVELDDPNVCFDG